MGMWLEENLPLIIFFLLGFYLVLRSRLVLRRYEEKYLRVWKEMAEKVGLVYQTGSLFRRIQNEHPSLRGEFQDREVEITAYRNGKNGYWKLFLKFLVTVDNPGTTKLPVGAFLIIQKDSIQPIPRIMSRFFYRERKDQSSDLRKKFQMRSIPANLGNHIFLLPYTEKLLSHSSALSLLIDRHNLTYCLTGLSSSVDEMVQILEDLCELASDFESFARNWL